MIKDYYLERKTKPAKFLIFTIIFFSVMKLVEIIYFYYPARHIFCMKHHMTIQLDWSFLTILNDFWRFLTIFCLQCKLYIQGYIQIYIHSILCDVSEISRWLISRSIENLLKMTSPNFRVGLCRIGLSPRLNSKVKWTPLWTTLKFKFTFRQGLFFVVLLLFCYALQIIKDNFKWYLHEIQ